MARKGGKTAAAGNVPGATDGLQLEIKDFGPISRGTIDLKPLTVFVGPNNSGKSYAAMLVHSVLNANSSIGRAGHDRPMISSTSMKRAVRNYREQGIDTLARRFSDVGRGISQLQPGREIRLPSELVDGLADQVLRTALGEPLRQRIERAYGCSLASLVRIGKKTFQLGFGSAADRFRVTGGATLKVKGIQDYSISVIPEDHPPFRLNEEEAFDRLKWLGVKFKDPQGGTFSVTLLVSALPDSRSFDTKQFLLTVCRAWKDRILSDFSSECHYLPAGRTGILEGSRDILVGLVKRAGFADAQAVQPISLSGLVADFIESMLTFTGEKTPFSDLSAEFEERLIRGNVALRELKTHTFPEIVYTFLDGKGEIPLERASSAVSELAPLFLFVKHAVTKGNLLIIEEPEAHLHPESQRVLVQFLVRLIREGVRVLLTTHSEYLLEQFGNFIMLSTIDAKKRREKYGYEEDDYLRLDEVGAYLFKFDKRSRAYRIKPVDVTEETGIAEDGFTEVHQELYNETIALEREALISREARR